MNFFDHALDGALSLVLKVMKNLVTEIVPLIAKASNLELISGQLTAAFIQKQPLMKNNLFLGLKV